MSTINELLCVLKLSAELNVCVCNSHVVVCGCVNFTLTHSFIEDFLHKERQRSDIKCVFLDTYVQCCNVAAL